jgi:hypothetical protein
MSLCSRSRGSLVCEGRFEEQSHQHSLGVEREGRGDMRMDWTGLDWTGLDWTGLDWTGLVSRPAFSS